jgi:hypothetical protein
MKIFSELSSHVVNLPFDFDLFIPVHEGDDNSLNEMAYLFDISTENLISSIRKK